MYRVVRNELPFVPQSSIQIQEELSHLTKSHALTGKLMCDLPEVGKLMSQNV